MLLASACLFAACGKTAPEEVLPERTGYSGTLSVVELGDELFQLEDILTDYTLDAVSGRLDIYMYDVSFSSRMPITINVLVLPDVAYEKNGTTLAVSDTDIVPLMEMGGEMIPYDRYVCTDFTGTITPSAMTLSMKLGGFRTEYSGRAL